MKNLLLKLVDHMRYPSTYQGLVALLTTVGIHLAPQLTDAIAAAGVGVFGLLALLFSDADVVTKKKK